MLRFALATMYCSRMERPVRPCQLAGWQIAKTLANGFANANLLSTGARPRQGQKSTKATSVVMSLFPLAGVGGWLLGRCHSLVAELPKELRESTETDPLVTWLPWLPIATGTAGIAGVLLNRIVSGIAPVADAGSAQSRADVLAIAMSGVLLLTGLQGLSVRPRSLVTVDATAPDVCYLRRDLPEGVVDEIKWSWAALELSTRATGMVVFWKGACVCHLGFANASGYVPGAAAAGPICEQAMASGVGNYLPNLALYPGRLEFLKYFPETTQGILVQPLGKDGVLVLATQTQRGFGQVDQAWAATLAQKLDASLDVWEPT